MAEPRESATPGATVLAFPEPPRRRRRRFVLIGIGIAVVLVVGLMGIALFSPALALKEIKVNATGVVPPADISKQLESLKGKPLPRITDAEVDAQLSRIVQLKSWNVRYEPPGTMVVTVVERSPVALLKKGKAYSLIDSEGTVLAEGKDPGTTKLPVVDSSDKAMTGDVYRTVTTVLGSLPAGVLAQMASATATTVDSVTLNLINGKQVVWGNASEMALKARALEALLKLPENPEAPVKVYDVSTPNKPVTR